MARSINDIEIDLLALPREDRAHIALDLIRSLDNDDEPLSHEEWEAACGWKKFSDGRQKSEKVVPSWWTVSKSWRSSEPDIQRNEVR